ncbi:hypothetical protein MMC09_000814 [Bachmanniomyces sp. S44760]|nr:hypothetical protein [Bachmanniomyces sp. S44760]
MMGTRVFNTIEPENIKTILALRFHDFGLGNRRKQAFSPLLGSAVFNSDGDEWKHSRGLLRPNFTLHQLNDLGILEGHTRNLIDRLTNERSATDLQDVFFRFTMDVATEWFFGESCLSLLSHESEASDQFNSAFNRAQRTIAVNYTLGPFAKLADQTQFKTDCKLLHEFVDRYVREALAIHSTATKSIAHPEEKPQDPLSSRPKDRYLFLRELVAQTQDPAELRSQLLSTLVAGRDTTASLLSNLWFVLARRQDIWAKLRAEIDTLDGRKPDFAELKTLKYLQWCINECTSISSPSISTSYLNLSSSSSSSSLPPCYPQKLIPPPSPKALRLHPPVPVNSRTALRDTSLPLGGGPNGTSPIYVPAGTVVGYNVYAMHRRPDIYGANASEFEPERWRDARVGWGFLPFNGGARICLGQQLALTEASYVTVRLMQTFDKIESTDGQQQQQPWMELMTLTCCSKNGVKVKLGLKGEGEEEGW